MTFDYEYEYLWIAAVCIVTVGLLTLAFLLIKKSMCAKKETVSGLVTPLMLSRLFDARHRDGGDRAVIYVNVCRAPVSDEADYRVDKTLSKNFEKYINRLISSKRIAAGAYIDGNNYVLAGFDNSENLKKLGETFEKTVMEDPDMSSIPEYHLGIYICGDEGEDFGSSFINAKKAAKYAFLTKKQWVVYNPEDMAALSEHDFLAESMEKFIEDDAFYVVIQPIVDAKTDRVVGGEMLSRLTCASKDRVMPAQFIEIIREKNLHRQFDYYVFEKCCRWAAMRAEAGDNRVVSCNFSRVTQSAKTFTGDIIGIADKYNVRRDLIAIEVTEHDISGNNDIFIENMKAVHEAGFRLYIDDFGTGVTGFADLQEFPVDVVKIDKTIIDNLDTEKGRIICKNTIEMVKNLNMKVLCEGVETEKQRRLVEEMGCDLIQGFYFYGPVSVSEYKEVLDSENS